jgi:uncharacterized protein
VRPIVVRLDLSLAPAPSPQRKGQQLACTNASRNPSSPTRGGSTLSASDRTYAGTTSEPSALAAHTSMARQMLCAIPVASILLRSDNMLALLFGAISLLYATVGQAGGTSFLALMAFASFSPGEMRPTALMLNIVAASYTTWLFNRAGLVDSKKLAPLLASSLPMAVVGGLIVLNEQIYKTLTGLVFLVAAGALAFQRTNDGELEGPAPLWGAISIGAVIGFVSGLTGVGGGLFLAPLLIALRWAPPKQTAALSAPFNLANSVLGLLGVMYAGQAPAAQTWLYAIAAAAGAVIGTSVGLRWLSQTMTRYILAVVLGAAGIQFLFF